MAEKKVNYTEAQTSAMKASYEAGKTVEEIAVAMNRAVRSVRSKLVKEGVYVAPVKAPAAPKAEGPTKKELLAVLRGLVPDAVADGFANATKDAIQAVIDRLTPASEAE